MREHETIRGYLDAVQAQIRWKQARPVLAQELERHLEDQRDAFVQDGKSPEEAEQLATADMGDPVALGMELDRVHRPKPQWGLLGLTLAIACTGAVLRVTLTAGWTDGSIGLAQTVLALGLGSAALLGMYFLDVSRLARYAGIVYLAALVAGVLASYLSPVQMNVPYYARYVVSLYPVAYTFLLYRLRQKGWKGFILAIAGELALGAVCIMIPYLQSFFALLVIGFVLLLCAVCQDWFNVPRKATLCSVLALGAGALAFFVYLWFIRSSKVRLQIALHPELDPLNRGYMGVQVKKVLNAAQWLGEGVLDTSVLPFQRFLPNAATDMLPTTIVYRLGWLPYLLLLAVLAALLGWLLIRGLKQTHQLGRMLVLAVTLTLGIQALFSVVLNTGFVFWSAHLPFVVGNLHTILDMALVGLTLSVFRGSSILRDEPIPASIPRKRIRIHIRIEYQ